MSMELVDVSVVYEQGSAPVHALSEVDLTIEDGEYIAIIGPNGAGKSTLMNVLAGSVTPTRGRVLLDGADVTGLPDHKRARAVSRVFQDPTKGTCDGLTVMENAAVAFRRGRRRSPFRSGCRSADVQAFTSMLESHGRGLGEKLDEDVVALSGGQRQLISMMMAVSADPRVLLLDEHTSALDPEIGARLMSQTDSIIRDRSLTAVMVTHNMRLAAAYGDRLLVMSGGSIVDDISGDEKRQLGESGLIDRFRTVADEALTDRMLG